MKIGLKKPRLIPPICAKVRQTSSTEVLGNGGGGILGYPHINCSVVIICHECLGYAHKNVLKGSAARKLDTKVAKLFPPP